MDHSSHFQSTRIRIPSSCAHLFQSTHKEATIFLLLLHHRPPSSTSHGGSQADIWKKQPHSIPGLYRWHTPLKLSLIIITLWNIYPLFISHCWLLFACQPNRYNKYDQAAITRSHSVVYFTSFYAHPVYWWQTIGNHYKNKQIRLNKFPTQYMIIFH